MLSDHEVIVDESVYLLAEPTAAHVDNEPFTGLLEAQRTHSFFLGRYDQYFIFIFIPYKYIHNVKVNLKVLITFFSFDKKIVIKLLKEN